MSACFCTLLQMSSSICAWDEPWARISVWLSRPLNAAGSWMAKTITGRATSVAAAKVTTILASARGHGPAADERRVDQQHQRDHGQAAEADIAVQSEAERHARPDQVRRAVGADRAGKKPEGERRAHWQRDRVPAEA